MAFSHSESLARAAPMFLAESMQEQHAQSALIGWNSPISVTPRPSNQQIRLNSDVRRTAENIVDNPRKCSRGGNSFNGGGGGGTPVAPTQNRIVDGYVYQNISAGACTAIAKYNISEEKQYLGAFDEASFQQLSALFPREIVIGRYTDLQLLGGHYGTVVKAIQITNPFRAVALKRLQTLMNHMVSKRCLRELRILRRLRNHPNIIELLDVQIDSECNLYLVQPLMQGDLRRVLVELHMNKQFMLKQDVQRIMYQILCALKYVHSANVIHRDVKPENLLVDFAGGTYQVKLCDFGLARVDATFDQSNLPFMTPQLGTDWYSAPEVVMPANYIYTRAADIWSAGCILAELLNNQPLFSGDKLGGRQFGAIVQVLGVPNCIELQGILSRTDIDPQTLKLVTECLTVPNCGAPPPSFQRNVVWANRFPHADSDALELLDEMLQYRPGARPRAERLLERAFLADYHHADKEPSCSKPFTKQDLQIDHLDCTSLWTYLLEEVRIFLRTCAGAVMDGSIASNVSADYYGPAAPVEVNRGARLPPRKEFNTNSTPPNKISSYSKNATPKNCYNRRTVNNTISPPNNNRSSYAGSTAKNNNSPCSYPPC